MEKAYDRGPIGFTLSSGTLPPVLERYERKISAADADAAITLAPGGRYAAGRRSERRAVRGMGRFGIGRERAEEGLDRTAYACFVSAMYNCDR
jgi:hypothetical protein